MPTLESYADEVSDGATVEVPKGTYTLSESRTITASDWKLVAPDGAVVRVESNSPTWVLRGDNWTFGGFRFDVGPGRNIQLRPRGGPWRLEGCAWDGKNGNRQFLIQPEINNAGTTGEIDRCWLGEGTAIDPSTGDYWNESAIKGLSNIRGPLRITRSYFYQNGAYIAPTDTSRADTHTGSHHYDSCYSQDCYLGFTRIGVPHGNLSTVRRATCVFTDYSNVPPTASGQKRSRGPWFFYGDGLVEDCDLAMEGEQAVAQSHKSRHGAGTVTVRNCEVQGSLDADVTENIGSNPSTDPPDGCVTSAADATGISADGSLLESSINLDGENTIEFIE